MLKTIDVLFILYIIVFVLITCIFNCLYAISILLISIGTLLVLCKRLKDRSLLAKTFEWLSSNLLFPTNKYNHIIWGIIFVFLGILFFFKFDTGKYESFNYSGYENWWYYDPVLYLIIGLLIAIGIYRTNQRK